MEAIKAAITIAAIIAGAGLFITAWVDSRAYWWLADNVGVKGCIITIVISAILLGLIRYAKFQLQR